MTSLPEVVSPQEEPHLKVPSNTFYVATHARYLERQPTHFTQLSCYAPDNVDTDEKNQDWFLNNLNDGISYALEARDFVNFQAMVDKALVLENRRGIMECKRKMQHTRAEGGNTRFHVGFSSQGPIFFHSQQSGQ
jgi:hypothetical protein